MTADRDASLARSLRALVDEELSWLGDYPDDQVDPEALASLRRSLDWSIERLPPGERDGLPATIGLFVDLTWWLDSCDDDAVDPFAAVKILESSVAAFDDLPHERFLEVLGELATTEPHEGRRLTMQALPFEFGLVDGDEPVGASRDWVRPEDRS